MVEMMDARKDFEAGKYEKAERTLKEILVKIPDDKEARAMLSSVLERLDVNYIQRTYVKMQSFYLEKDYKGVQQEAQKVLVADPGHRGAKLYTLLAKTQVALGLKQYAEAKSILFELLKIDSKNEEAFLLLKRVQTILDVTGHKDE